MTWEAVRIRDVATFLMGQAPPGAEVNDVGIGTPFFRSGEFEDIRPKVVAWTTKPLRLALPTDVFVCVVGANAGEVNRGADGAIGRSIGAVRAGKDLDSDFLYYFLRSIETYLRNAAQGSAQPVISKDDLGRIELFLPPLAEQRAIAGVLGALDDKIESNRRLIDVAKELIAVEFVRTLESAEGDRRFTDLYSRADRVVQTGPFGSNLHASDYEDQGTPLILVKHVLDGEIALTGLPLIGEEKVTELASYRVMANDIVLTRVGRIGDAALVPQVQEGWLISGQMLRMRMPKGSVIPSWLTQWFLGAAFLERIAGYSVGSTRMSLSTGILMEVPFPNVPVQIQRDFDEETSPLRERVTKARAENLALSGIRDALLPELLSGRLRVKDAESMMEDL